ncbi:hypothetical protein CgunFtcFv8_026509 [Champsocephalus gunnari]|uniref:Uncharacterized protein n=1 Tax=Champsocephalus gunnari TaxID=52237 RepID=A0AAN8E2B2_CHAGU|nr:hypothetical protein CgunFtcFv8_026509 [Champsocephalus gunnari]
MATCMKMLGAAGQLHRNWASLMKLKCPGSSSGISRTLWTDTPAPSRLQPPPVLLQLSAQLRDDSWLQADR